MGMARSTFYDEGVAEGTATAAPLERMRAIQDEFPAYGYRRITAQLRAGGEGQQRAQGRTYRDIAGPNA